MRIATWNVNSLKARQEKVEQWIGQASPDVLLLQETKLTDADAPVMTFAMLGYDLVHHGEGRWNGVAVAVRQGRTVEDPETFTLPVSSPPPSPPPPPSSSPPPHAAATSDSARSPAGRARSFLLMRMLPSLRESMPSTRG